MAFVSSQKSRVLIGTQHLSPKADKVSVPWSSEMLEVSTLNDTAKAFIVGLRTSTATVSGFLDTDATTGGQFEAINSWTSTQPLTYAPSGLALGSELWMTNALKSSVEHSAEVAGVVAFALSAQTDGLTDFGRSLHDLTAETASTNSSSYDNSASTANGGVGHLHVSAYSGLTNAIVTIEHSTNNSTWATLSTFATATGTTSERLVVAAGTTVNRYLRAVSTITGTGSVTFAVGFARR